MLVLYIKNIYFKEKRPFELILLHYIIKIFEAPQVLEMYADLLNYAAVNMK